jgi:hypothetical protein
MKLRLLPVIFSVAVSSAVLFGGWFTYNSLAMENPLANIINKAPGVESSTLDFSSNQANIKLTLKPDADLREIVQKITKDGSSMIGQRKVNFDVSGQSSPELDAWWSKALFDVAQAMETRQYAEIPKALQSHAAELSGLQVNTEMDENNVYIRLTDGKYSKFVILPRIPAQMGVWQNGQAQ